MFLVTWGLNRVQNQRGKRTANIRDFYQNWFYLKESGAFEPISKSAIII